MTNVFQPSVFQPNVFQVGTLDVVIPDVVTKRRKWLSLSVPGSGRVSGASAFAVSRDSAGILIGVRDKAAPQFAVSRDAEGLLLSGWPVVQPAVAAGEWNYVQNPRFHVGTEGWGAAGCLLDRVTSTPFGLPPGADAAARFTGFGYLYAIAAECGSVVVSESANLPVTVTFGVEGVGTFTVPSLRTELICRNQENAIIEGPSWRTHYFEGANQWHTQTDVFFVPFGTANASLRFDFDPSYESVGIVGCPVYITLVRLGGTTYADGDSAGWAWDGAAHNSNSRKLS